MSKIFIASSLKKPFPIIRKELKAALKRFNLSIVMWEKNRPGGSKIPEGEKYMITEAKACVFLLGCEYSQGTLDEYKIAKDLGKLIILVDVTPIEGKEIHEMNTLLKKEIWDQNRAEKLITLTWTQSDEVAMQISTGFDRAFPGEIEKFLKITESKDQNAQLRLPKGTRDNIVMKLIIKQFSRGFEHTINPNPEIRYLVSWQYCNYSFYLLTVTSHTALQSLIEISELLASNEILCIYGPKKYLDRLKDKIRYLPITTTLTETEIKDRLLNFEEYMV